MPKGVARNGPSGRPRSIEPISLAMAKGAMIALVAAEQELADAIVIAVEAGNSAHHVSLAIGLDYGTVLSIARQERPSPFWKSSPPRRDG